MTELLRSARINRFAKICCNLCLFCGVVLLILGAMPVMSFFYYIIAAAITLVALVAWLLVLLLTWHPFDLSFIEAMFGGGIEVYTKIKEVALVISPWIGAAALIFGVIAIPLFAVNKKSGSTTGRIVAASLGIGFAVIGLILVYAVVSKV